MMPDYVGNIDLNGSASNIYRDNWLDAMDFRKSLVSDGWKTPNTYDNFFAFPTKGPAVYLFLLHGWDTKHDFHNFETALVAYVGMSKKLRQRWATHVVLREIEATGRYIQKWFLPTPDANLRDCERKLIKSFDPPWNIQGRKRGVAL